MRTLWFVLLCHAAKQLDAVYLPHLTLSPAVRLQTSYISPQSLYCDHQQILWGFVWWAGWFQACVWKQHGEFLQTFFVVGVFASRYLFSVFLLSCTSRAGSASSGGSSASWRCLLKCCGLQTNGKIQTKVAAAAASSPVQSIFFFLNKLHF